MINNGKSRCHINPFNDRPYEAECHNVHAWSMYISTSCNNKTTIYYFYVYFKTVAHNLYVQIQRVQF